MIPRMAKSEVKPAPAPAPPPAARKGPVTVDDVMRLVKRYDASTCRLVEKTLGLPPTEG